MSYSPTDVVRTLRDLGSDDVGSLEIMRLDDQGVYTTDEPAEALFKELLVEDILSYSKHDLGETLLDELKREGLIP